MIPNGVPEAPAVTIRESPVPLRVGGLGRLTGQKGFDMSPHRRDRPAPGRRAGRRGGDRRRGTERPVLERAARGLPVAFPGWVREPGPFSSGLDVFCLPSRWEGLPFALLEAMVRGLPCVCTPVGDVAAAVGDSCVRAAPDDPGQLADALRELAVDSGRRQALGAAARERALARLFGRADGRVDRSRLRRPGRPAPMNLRRLDVRMALPQPPRRRRARQSPALERGPADGRRRAPRPRRHRPRRSESSSRRGNGR